QADGNRRARREEGSYYRFVRNALNEVASDHTAAIRTCYSTSISRTAFRARIASTWFRILSPSPIVHGMASMKINGDEASEVFNCDDVPRQTVSSAMGESLACSGGCVSRSFVNSALVTSAATT